MNSSLINHFENLTFYYQLAKDELEGTPESSQMNGRLITFSNALNVIVDTKFEITSGQQIKRPGIAKGTIDEINEFLNNGETQRLNELKARFPETNQISEVIQIEGIDPKLAAKYYKEGFTADEILEANPYIQYFMSFYGIGFKKAARFYRLGFRTLADLWYKARLTDGMKQGILWRKHLVQRIPRSEMDQIDELFSKLFKDYYIAGSYRRGNETSGDIDLLIYNGNIKEVVDTLTDNYLVATLGFKEQFQGIFRLSPDFVARRIDITIIHNLSFALLHSTGSDNFNKLMRSRAIELGYKLSQYDLEGYEGEINDEKDIFDALRVEYLAPEQRSEVVNLTYF